MEVERCRLLEDLEKQKLANEKQKREHEEEMKAQEDQYQNQRLRNEMLEKE
ncbi:hypothetical protein T440DRAFT_515375 [Plenodomus tracheiphilus IPT5]|uniref:Uncharacterized protein n=1 Tax=Plenodomus tracheiphilus IPT5 TaxID=1408161 RepID=A0A6A7BF60_9PLEO|nr:hypothetical protein T440DRAFT_515375 [Plenodomus tracheiphilus IPT5]